MQRVEYERPLRVAGSVGQLYVSSGPSDDYLELVLPDGADEEERNLERLARLAQGASCDTLDVRLAEGKPPTACVLALYVDQDERCRPYDERVQGILATLASAVPDLDFGDLLPEHLKPKQPLGADAQVALTVPAEASFEAAVATAGAAADPAIGHVPAAELPRAQTATGQAPGSVPASGDSISHPRPRLVADLVGRAGDLAARGRVHKALRAIEDALRQDASDMEAWHLREELTLLEKRERRRQREPRSAQAQLEVGFSYLTLGCDDEAIAALKEAVRLQPDLYIAHVILGIAYHHQKQAKAAGLCYERAARLRPRDGTPRELLRSLRRGEPPPQPVEDRPQLRARLSQIGFGQRYATAG